MESILLIEDNLDTRRFMEVMLAREFKVLVAENGIKGLEIARAETPSLILMDVVMPVLNGYDTCKLLKEDERTRLIPVIFLSSRNTTTDITYGLSVGADDYIPKPFDYKEVLSRLKSCIERRKTTNRTMIQAGPFVLDTSTREVLFEGKRISLTLTEYDILRYLALKKGVVVSRAEIMKELWKDDASQTSDRTIDVHIRSLRKKLPSLTKHIHSIYGVGYRFES